MSRQSIVSIRIARLERAQRFAGEAFGHEELGPLPVLGLVPSQQAWLVWALVAAVASAALAVIALR